MAENRSTSKSARKPAAKNTSGAPAQRKKQAGTVSPKKSQAKAVPERTREGIQPREPRDENSLLHRVLPYVFVVCAVLLTICFITGSGKGSDEGGPVGRFMVDICLWTFGVAAYAIPVMLGYFALRWRKWVSEYNHTLKSIFAVVFFTFCGALVQCITVADDGVSHSFATFFADTFKACTDKVGGFFGGFFGYLLYDGFGMAAAIIISIVVIFVFSLFLFGISPKDIWINMKYGIKMNRERRKTVRAAAEREREFDYYPVKEHETENFVPPETSANEPVDDFDMNVADDMYTTDVSKTAENEQKTEISEEEFDEPEAGARPIPDMDTVINAAVSSQKPAADSVYDSNGHINLDAIFVDPELSDGAAEEPEVGGVDIGGGLDTESATLDLSHENTLDVVCENVETAKMPETKPQIQRPSYRFPPITLLSVPEQKKNDDVGAELRSNAKKLIDTLHSFRVNVTISSVSRGPTITRYELIPEAGTRVRSIANLVDDISLSLATSGIRIEAPIPGKSAVGIEVPNRVVSTVSLRELIEDKSFKEAKGKLTVCLGKDVGGAPIIFDISKMPHLLIAGATGMGKSVCINSIITSILYKATPDEVKLVLIDPKKVEFNIYNGIPHLQTPVVSDPKKAAGALHWAVTEMERRYELIEEVGARKIEGYNEIARARGIEVLPYTVIIIDELADLMMTAPDAVEESICRLAQKARAAGMHIIIGTQRPSVDVITGLIKANIPSRIAFTVASQVDSRTIIDIAGAEKLIGRGDMLYYPVGISKPMRAQGAFVSEDEVEQITSYIKQNSGETEYDEDIIESIDREAQTIGQSGKKTADPAADDGAGDPKLRDALEIATDMGKISTSLLQRKLQIGYGRAAKIIDIMEARGFVSAPDGQKPREVLITKTQYREMVVNNDERLS